MHDNQFFFFYLVYYLIAGRLGDSQSAHFRSRRRELVIVLRFGIIEQLCGLLVGLLGLGILLNLLQEGRVGEGTLLGDSETTLCAGAGQAPVQPSHDVGEQLVEVDARQNGSVGPSNQRDVGDGVLSTAWTSDVVAVGEARVEDAVEALRLAYITLNTIGNLFLGETEEVIGLTLPVVRKLGSVSIGR